MAFAVSIVGISFTICGGVVLSKRKIGWVSWGLDQVWWQIRAAVFGIAFLAAIVGTAVIWSPDWALARNDALFGVGVVLMVAVFWTGVNRMADAVPIGIVFLLGIGLELHRTGVGAWAYADGGVLKLGAKPLFVGFMYAAVASYVIRSLRLKELVVTRLPHWAVAAFVSVSIYGMFFVGVPDWVRPAVLALAVIVFGMARVVAPSGSWLPVPVALGLAAVLLWCAENVGTFSGTWTYRGQGPGELVDLTKISAWFLLLTVIFWVVTYFGRTVSDRQGATR
ncbi:MAG: DUF817 family protein [Pseudomonadota bacterium]